MLIQSIDIEHLAEISADILIICSPDGNIGYCNKTDKTLDAFDTDEGFIQLFFGKKHKEQIEYYLHQAIKTHHPLSFIVNNSHKHTYQMRLHAYNKKIFAAINDISEKTEQGRLLKETTARLNFAERIAHIGYWEVDLQERKIFWSPEMFRIFDTESSRIATKRNIIKEKIIKEDLPVYKRKLRELLKSNNPVEGRLRLKNKNGRITYCVFKADIINKSDNKKIAGTFQDLSELIEIQKKLNAAKLLAEQANREKSYFLAQASHDLRQPLQALNIFVNLLQEENLSSSQQNLTEKIAVATFSLKNMLDNILDISRLEAGGAAPNKTWFNIGKLIAGLLLEYEDAAREKKIKIHNILCDKEIFSDALMIERILRNYLNNALKFAKSKIIVGCRQKGCLLTIIVGDDGPGIKKDEQKLIFDEFYQSGNIPNNSKNGTGLGLAIVQKTAQLINAEYGVDSVPGHGSRFWLRLDICGPNIKKSPHKAG